MECCDHQESPGQRHRQPVFHISHIALCCLLPWFPQCCVMKITRNENYRSEIKNDATLCNRVGYNKEFSYFPLHSPVSKSSKKQLTRFRSRYTFMSAIQRIDRSARSRISLSNSASNRWTLARRRCNSGVLYSLTGARNIEIRIVPMLQFVTFCGTDKTACARNCVKHLERDACLVRLKQRSNTMGALGYSKSSQTAPAVPGSTEGQRSFQKENFSHAF